ncbi:DNA-directed RNA polymerase subunit [Venustampulla echinocandica]|uniref:DNA-directed RNA polymerase subunit n=1 Tax=Venustampulla echinocandica TaxID=2656787 RepID=A0A370TAJ6_9HELO|nr:DNA-directed RNA polymerase subunit [Venustampulla echinocandica]RDL30828.1 DNA-directed RNA polymerase subunit [Venustampulla echinocandica]
MSAVGSLVFCTECGNLLDISTGNTKNILICDCCGAENKDNASKTIVTKSNPSSFPSALRAKRSIFQKVERDDLENTQKAQETCTACGRTEVTFVSVQLRSADEGSTIFYTCDCGNKWNTNN